MTGTESRLLHVGAKVIWKADKDDDGVIIETNWSGVVVKWNGRGRQSIMHNDMTLVTVLR
jgi:hypothetical protein